MANSYFIYGIAKHICVYCGSKFRHKINLKRHYREAHSDKPDLKQNNRP